MHTDERVILLDDEGGAIGSALKATVHSAHTPLQLAFSCYIFNAEGELLLSRRALSKATWPGVWSNSFCGHPAPGEGMQRAIARRASDELGAEITSVELAAPDFRYRATDASGIVENEICPVYVARLASDLQPNPHEVVDTAWVGLDRLAEAVTHTPFAFSPWLALQLPHVLSHAPEYRGALR